MHVSSKTCYRIPSLKHSPRDHGSVRFKTREPLYRVALNSLIDPLCSQRRIIDGLLEEVPQEESIHATIDDLATCLPTGAQRNGQGRRRGDLALRFRLTLQPDRVCAACTPPRISQSCAYSIAHGTTGAKAKIRVVPSSASAWNEGRHGNDTNTARTRGTVTR